MGIFRGQIRLDVKQGIIKGESCEKTKTVEKNLRNANKKTIYKEQFTFFINHLRQFRFYEKNSTFFAFGFMLE